MAHILIIGGSDAGISAALRAREIDPDAIVTVIVSDSFPNYSICGLPFYVSGEVSDWRSLAHRTIEEIEREGIRLLLNHTATMINPAKKMVEVIETGGPKQTLSYDRLVIATGAVPVRPEIAGVVSPGVYLLHTMQDSFQIHQHVAETNPQTAVIIGAGYIGMEMADAFRHRKLQVTLIARSGVMRRTVDAGPARIVEDELIRHDVKVIKRVDVEAIEREGSHLAVVGSNGFRTSTDLVLIAAGVQPSSELAESAGIHTGLRGAIRVTRQMETNIPDIFAAGDCVETWHHVTNQYTYLPLGTTAHKQGRIAGENAVDGHRQFEGSLGTQIVKIFDLAVASTGLREAEARDAGFDPLTVENKTWDHKAYYPGAHELLIRITGDRRSGRLLGAQIVGHWQAEVAKRIDIFATALFHRMKVEGLIDLDLSYTPPVSSPWDPVQMAAIDWVKHLER
jgi:NADPH-dependent 2,4-dienoyl-CoA reductase/sulfur reductase-like enzyme